MNTKTSKNIKEISIYAIIMLISIVIVLPLLYIISISLSNDADVMKYGYRLIPKSINFNAYKQTFATPEIVLRAYGISIIVTILGTIMSLYMTTTVAYVVSRRDYAYKKFTSIYLFIPLIFNGGMVASYIINTQVLHINNTLLALMLPYGVNVWYVFMLRGFMASLSLELIEAAKIDGANEYKIFFTIIIPLSKPGIATIGLFYAFTFWNDWWLAMLYITNDKLMPLQYLLQRMMMNLEFFLKQLPPGFANGMDSVPIEGSRMAMAIVAAGPMLILFPFFQKYFVKGISVGSIKG